MSKWFPDGDTLDAWEDAATDAAIDPASVHLFVATAGSGGEYGAMYYAPGMWAFPGDDSFDFSDGLRVRLRELIDERVVVVSSGLTSDRRLLVMRHEAEHVGQDTHNPFIGQVGMRLYDLFSRAFYGAVPHERDADAAATLMCKSRGLAATQADLAGDNRKLYDAEWARPDRGSLPLRLLAYSLLNPSDFDTACRSDSSWTRVEPDDLLERLVPGASKVRAAVGDDYVRPTLDAIASEHTEESWAELPREEKNAAGDAIRQRLVRVENTVVEQIRPLLADHR